MNANRPMCESTAHWAAVLFLLLPGATALANGAAWNFGSTSGAIGPVQRSDLVLEREHVVFQREGEDDGVVTAHFWIANRTDKAARVTMGFPLVIDQRTLAPNADRSDLETYARGFLRPFEVSVDGKAQKVDLRVDVDGPYSVTNSWEMVFPARKTTEYTVRYQMDISWSAADTESGDLDEAEQGFPILASSYVSTFEYITHTGSFWAEPIGEATLEYCDKRLFEDLLQNRASTGLEIRLHIQPERYHLDWARQCVVWRRTEWKPAAGKDDILVRLQEAYYYDGEEPAPREWNLPIDAITSVLPQICRRTPELGSQAKLDRIALDEKRFKELVTKSFRALFVDGFEIDLQKAPQRIQWMFELHLLRYLRNHIAARHGHHFKDEVLQNCFRDLPKAGRWKEIELRNIKAIQKLERITNRKLSADASFGTDISSGKRRADKRSRHALGLLVRSLPDKLPERLLSLLTKRDLRILRNAVYARHGRPFEDPALRSYFSRVGTYKPDPGFSASRLDASDHHNLALIKKAEALP